MCIIKNLKINPMLKSFKPTIIVAGETKSIFFEIFFKVLKKKKVKNPLILIASKKILQQQMGRFNFRKKIKLLDCKNLKNTKLNNKSINLIDVIINNSRKDYKNYYIKESFDIAFKLIKSRYSTKFINGPINKKNFLKRKFLGITEYISGNFKTKNTAMLIYNENLSVCPITTHLPLKLVPKKISKKLIFDKTILINNFYKNVLRIKPKIAVTGLNPHCESILTDNEDKKIITPAIKKLKKKGLKVDGPFPADTMFLKKNRKKYNVIIGMYHDQVLTPMKTLKEHDAFNITLGLPFFRISPDHGPNEKMVNQNKSNPTSLLKAIKFLEKK